jgi:hypothetical protein
MSDTTCSHGQRGDATIQHHEPHGGCGAGAEGPARARSINVENILDATYYATSHGNNNIMPGAPRRISHQPSVISNLEDEKPTSRLRPDG